VNVIRLQGRNARVLFEGFAAVFVTALALIACPGCGSDDTTPEIPGAGAAPGGSMTEAQYIAHLAALTVAVGEGLTGEAAEERAMDLGSAGHTREEVERFAERLKARPERWLEIEREIEERVNVMTRPEPPGAEESR
jgi:hypothetical protein